jgi:WD40 repeat protein
LTALSNLLKCQSRPVILAGCVAALCALWFGLWLRELPLRPRLEWSLPELEEGEQKIFQVSDDSRILLTAQPVIPPTDGVFPICVWDITTGRLVRVIGQPGGSFSDFSLSSDGSRCVYQANPREAWLLDARTGKGIRRWERDYPRLQFSPDGRTLVEPQAYAEGKQALCLFDSDNGELLGQFPPAGDCLRLYANCAYSPDSRILAIYAGGPEGNQVQVWDIATRRLILRVVDAHPPLVFSPDSASLAFVRSKLWGFAEGPIAIVDVHSGTEVATLAGHDGITTELFFHRNGTGIVALDNPEPHRWWLRKVTTWNLGTSAHSLRARPDDGQAHLLNWREHIRTHFRCWRSPEVFTFEDLLTGAWHSSAASGQEMDISPDAKFIAYWESPSDGLTSPWASESTKKTPVPRLVLMNVQTGSKVRLVEHPRDWMFTPDGTTLITQTDHGRIQIWDLPPRHPLLLLFILSAVPALLLTGPIWWRLGR